MNRLRILTWHIHGSYLYYLAHVPHDIYVPVKPGRPEAYGGRGGTLPWPDNLHEVAAEDVESLPLDCILYQAPRNYLEDQYEILTYSQRRLPRLYLEHDPPRQNPTDTRHIVDDPAMLLVHVTHFNDLMWNSGRTPTRVIDHGVRIPAGIRYTGEIPRGLVIVNDLPKRGRRLGLDVFERVRHEVPLDLVGINSEQLGGGLGEIPHRELPAFAARYRFLFNPIRYTSLGLSVCEAMMAGVPVVGLTTTEMAAAVVNGVSGFVDTNIGALISHMRRLLDHPLEAMLLSEGARRRAEERFSISRFIREWDDAFLQAISLATPEKDRAEVLA